MGRKNVFFKDGRLRHKSVPWNPGVDNSWMKVANL